MHPDRGRARSVGRLIAAGVAVALVATAALLAGCGGATDETADQATDTVRTEVSADATSAPSTSAPSTTAPAATSPTTTTPSTTSVFPPTVPTPVSVDPPGRAPDRSELLGIVDGRLVTVDRSTGTAARTVVDPFTGDGVFRGNLVRSPDGATLYFSEGYEDSWYACETSRGAVYALDLASGVETPLGYGGGLAVAPDGDTIAWLDSELCLVDPRAPATDVLTPADRVRILDLATGATTSVVVAFATPADATQFPDSLAGVWFDAAGDLQVATVSGVIRRVVLADPLTSVSLDPTPVGRLPAEAVAIGSSGDLVVAFADVTRTAIVAIDLSDGSMATWWTSTRWLGASIGSDGRVVVADQDVTGVSSTEHVEVLPGGSVSEVGA